MTTPPDLAGRLILITRPEPGAGETLRLITRCGGLGLLSPVLRVLPATDMGPFQAAMAELSTFDGVILTSAHAAAAFAAALPGGITPPPLLAVGRKSAGLLERHGFPVRVPERAEGGEQLGRAILEWLPEGRRFLFPRAEEGREELITLLQRAGREVRMTPVYRTAPVASLPEEVLRRLGEVDALPFFSPRSAEAFLDLLPGGVDALPARAVIAAITPLTARALSARGARVDLVAATADAEGVVAALADYWAKPPEAASRMKAATT